MARMAVITIGLDCDGGSDRSYDDDAAGLAGGSVA